LIDNSKETRSNYIYVPRDEEFSDTKQKSFDNGKKLGEQRLLNLAKTLGDNINADFPSFTAIDALFNGNLSFETPQVMKSKKEKQS